MSSSVAAKVPTETCGKLSRIRERKRRAAKW
jgi:hypothetical protein